MIARFLVLGLLLMTPLHAKVALITSASKGIGRATAQLLSERGYTVYGTCRSLESAPTSSPIRFAACDVRDLGALQSLVAKIIADEGRIDVLINNAAYGLGGPVECLSMEEIKEQMDVN